MARSADPGHVVKCNTLICARSSNCRRSGLACRRQAASLYRDCHDLGSNLKECRAIYELPEYTTPMEGPWRGVMDDPCAIRRAGG